MDDLFNSGNFSVRGYLPLIRKDFFIHMHDIAVYVQEGLPFERDLSIENSADSCICFRMAYFTQCLPYFSSIDHLVHLYARF